MSGPRSHFVGDGCEPPHVLTILVPEDPETVRERDGAHWNDITEDDYYGIDEEQEEV
jgi:hypothetical protein